MIPEPKSERLSDVSFSSSSFSLHSRSLFEEGSGLPSEPSTGSNPVRFTFAIVVRTHVAKVEAIKGVAQEKGFAIEIRRL